MNLVPCSENCRWQSDGMCTLKDLTRPANSARVRVPDTSRKRISSPAETARKPEPGISADVIETEPPKLFRRL